MTNKIEKELRGFRKRLVREIEDNVNWEINEKKYLPFSEVADYINRNFLDQFDYFLKKIETKFIDFLKEKINEELDGFVARKIEERTTALVDELRAELLKVCNRLITDELLEAAIAKRNLSFEKKKAEEIQLLQSLVKEVYEIRPIVKDAKESLELLDFIDGHFEMIEKDISLMNRKINQIKGWIGKETDDDEEDVDVTLAPSYLDVPLKWHLPKDKEEQ